MAIFPGLAFLVFWVPVSFLFVVAATYVGAKAALQSYFKDESRMAPVRADEETGD